MRELDRIDYEILAALRKNARLSNKELAAKVSLAPSSCWERVRRLEQEGVLKGAHAEVDTAALGVGIEAMIAVRLARHTREVVRSFHDELLELSNVLALYHVAGANDFMVHVAVENAEALRDLVIEVFAGRPEVAHIETALIFEHARTWGLPVFRVAEE